MADSPGPIWAWAKARPCFKILGPGRALGPKNGGPGSGPWAPAIFGPQGPARAQNFKAWPGLGPGPNWSWGVGQGQAIKYIMYYILYIIYHIPYRFHTNSVQIPSTFRQIPSKSWVLRDGETTATVQSGPYPRPTRPGKNKCVS